MQLTRALAFLLVLPFVKAQRGLTVRTSQGDVVGTFSAPTVRQFLGIPYATAKRWATPQLPPHRSTVFRATAFGPSCPQELTPANVEYLLLTKNQASNVNVTQSEDCLSINIWTPSTERKQNTAVLVWIYGGALVWGTSNISVYDGTPLVRDNHDITLVSFNYRLNIFGQPNAPQLMGRPVSQNFGLLDVEAAIKWVHENIATFGGDPERITLFGQSAGALAADEYLFAHPNDMIVKGTIQQSGNIILSVGFEIPQNTTFDPELWNSIAAMVGCGNASTPVQFTCMQAIPFKQLEDALTTTNINIPLVIDNITAFADPLDRLAAGEFLNVPVLGGTTAQEADVFIIAQEIVTQGSAPPVLTELISDLNTQAIFACATGSYLNARAKVGAPTWRYLYEGIFPGISTRVDLRAYHSSEIPMIFGTYNETTDSPSPAEVLLSQYMQQAWVEFARDPEHGLLKFGWPLYDPNSASLVQIGSIVNQTGASFVQGAMLDASCVHADVLTSISSQLSALINSTASTV